VSVQLASTVARTLDTDARTEQFEVREIWFVPIVALEWCSLCFQVNKPIVKIDGVQEGGRPILCG
jgi:hypothetical protein